MAGASFPAAAPKPLRGTTGAQRQKTVTGCIGCRLRRKKCDETRPQCLGCGRNGLLCVFPEAGNEEHARLLRRTNCTRKQPVYETGKHQVDPNISHSSTRLEDLSSPRMLGIEQCMVPGNHHLRQPASQRLLHHYINRTSKAMATCRDVESPFLTELIPVAMANDELVLNAILACSGIHLAALSGSVVDATTWVHYGQAVQNQKFALTQLVQGSSRPLVSATITAILLCIAETFLAGAGKQAMNHLKAAQAMMRQVLDLPKEMLDKGVRTFLVERVSYMITLAHVSLGSTHDQSILNDTAVLFSSIHSMPLIQGSSSSGCVHDLFWLIPQVSAIAHRASNEIRSVAQFTPEIIAEYQSLLCSVSSWEPKSGDEIYNSCGRVYQQALLVYLASVFDAESLSHPASKSAYSSMIHKAFECIEGLLDLSTLNATRITTTLCWPLAIFGACARTRVHQTFIDTKLATIAEAYASQSVRDTRDLLQRLWSSNNPRTYSPLELEQLMQEDDVTILFL
ncbi:hypothetical protein PFICI_00381 [Pestalotiopsis fici W106-1]|uniref:Zn(2)-C6 fungal-type domain-containing protein n=1 Tax=Pestalotiopsis fici (strain W106-1 / CGMCC3.15140) TaxID=1229662 RepID=W3XKH2_PESFW|nr:uncharacterized protein PFICI_00381 [Pestalotiopsis fici W106-1]ETS86553.1 hypothetical protein PFICI_00381 [Pestalotiopsis fici W106-1]